MSEPLKLPRNCGNCAHFDGDCWCSLPVMLRHMRGAIVEPGHLVCSKHELDTEAAHNEPLDGESR